MAHVQYRVVQHDGGWAYTARGAFSEAFATRAEASQAAHRAAAEQRLSGETVTIEYQDESGQWHTELSRGSDRPEADVVD